MIKIFLNSLLAFLLFKILWLLIITLSSGLYPVFDDGKSSPTILGLDLLIFFKIFMIAIFSSGLAFLRNNGQKKFLVFLIWVLIDENLKYKHLIGSNSYIETVGFYQLIFILIGALSFYITYTLRKYILSKVKRNSLEEIKK